MDESLSRVNADDPAGRSTTSFQGRRGSWALALLLKDAGLWNPKIGGRGECPPCGKELEAKEGRPFANSTLVLHPLARRSSTDYLADFSDS